MKAIVSVIGKDRVGIIAGVCNRLADENVNVLDLSQTILDGFFTMMMVVDVSECRTDFAGLSRKLSEYGDGVDLKIRVQRGDIFDAMSSI